MHLQQIQLPLYDPSQIFDTKHATWAKEIKEIRQVFNLFPLSIQEKIIVGNHALLVTSHDCPQHFFTSKQNHDYFVMFLGRINLFFAIELKNKLDDFGQIERFLSSFSFRKDINFLLDKGKKTLNKHSMKSTG